MKKNNEYMSGVINSCRIILAVRFMYASYNEAMFICTVDQLATVLKEHSNEKGIEFLKEFDPQKLTFKRVSKAQLLQWSNMDTEAYQYLSTHYFFN